MPVQRSADPWRLPCRSGDADRKGPLRLCFPRWLEVGWTLRMAPCDPRGQRRGSCDHRRTSTEEQRNALLTILSGKEQERSATYFNVFASTITKMNEPLFRPINFEADVSA